PRRLAPRRAAAGGAAGRDPHAAGRRRARLRRRADPALDRRARPGDPAALVPRAARLRPRLARARPRRARVGAARGTRPRRPRGRRASLRPGGRAPGAVRSLLPRGHARARPRRCFRPLLVVLSRPRTAPARSLSDDQPPAGTIPLRPRARIAGAPFGQTRGSSRGGVADPLT